MKSFSELWDVGVGLELDENFPGLGGFDVLIFPGEGQLELDQAGVDGVGRQHRLPEEDVLERVPTPDLKTIIKILVSIVWNNFIGNLTWDS